MKQIIALTLKWKINTEQKKQMMPRRSEKFSINNFNFNRAVARSREMYCEDGAIKVLQ